MTKHAVTRGNVMLLGGRGKLLPISLSGAGGVTIVNRGTVGIVALNKNSSSLGMGCRMSPLRNLGGQVNSAIRLICTSKCTDPLASGESPECVVPRKCRVPSTRGLARRTLGITRGTSVMLFFKNLGGGRRRSDRKTSHLNCGLPCKRSGLVTTLSGVGGGVTIVLVSNGTITVP